MLDSIALIWLLNSFSSTKESCNKSSSDFSLMISSSLAFMILSLSYFFIIIHSILPCNTAYASPVCFWGAYLSRQAKKSSACLCLQADRYLLKHASLISLGTSLYLFSIFFNLASLDFFEESLIILHSFSQSCFKATTFASTILSWFLNLYWMNIIRSVVLRKHWAILSF